MMMGRGTPSKNKRIDRIVFLLYVHNSRVIRAEFL